MFELTENTISALSLVISLSALLLSVKAYKKSSEKEKEENIKSRRKAMHNIDNILIRAIEINLDTLFSSDDPEEIYKNTNEIGSVITKISALGNLIDEVAKEVIPNTVLSLNTPYLSKCTAASYRLSKFNREELKTKRGQHFFFEQARIFFVNLLAVAAHAHNNREKTFFLDQDHYFDKINSWTRTLNYYSAVSGADAESESAKKFLDNIKGTLHQKT